VVEKYWEGEGRELGLGEAIVDEELALDT